MKLAAFILALCEVWSTPAGGPVYVQHLRRSPGGPEVRALLLARLFGEAAVAEGVRPSLLAAVAFHESGFNNLKRGPMGERCMMQLNMRNRANRAAIAKGTVRACIERGAAILARELRRCGSISSALGAYNSGRCNGAPLYARRVLAVESRYP